MIATYSFPARIHFGAGALASLTAFAATYRRPLIVTDKGLVATGLAEQVRAALGPAAVMFDGVDPNPTEANIHAGVAAFREYGCDLIVGVGGGSPLDAAKAIRLAVTHTLPLVAYDDNTGGDKLITADMPDMVAIPTPSGTGSEVSRSAVVTLDVNDRKTVLFSPFLMPTLAICDPALTLGLPPRLTAATGMDALSHNLEAYLSPAYHPMADAIALEGIRLVGKFLERAVRDGSDLEARSQMMMASLMGATAFQKGLGVTHSLAHPLSSVAGVHHGTANAILMPHVLTFNAVTVPERCQAIAEALGGGGTASEAVARLNRAISLPTRLSEVGVTRAMFPQLVEKAMLDGCRHTNPRMATADDLLHLYEQAF
ncbi:MAG: iron-containing alcohol dehydrogenase [Candidatus Sericytochromatia bacterium]|nr:iron-containing alcohol dehydrogenase [Candidatus Sericytochromatia bacterium]